MGEPEAPEERAKVHWSVPPPPPQPTEPEPHGEPVPLGEEFLFHLYRGSELLKEDQVYEAKGELERAIALQPKDVEGQSLLGVVYFRLGHYPRAIQIYEDLVRSKPTEVAPRVNLALCYLKTGQLPNARNLLEEIVQHRPDHLRAWGYLGLTHQRLGDLDKASVAFERAGRPQLAARLREARPSDPPPTAESVPAPSPGGMLEIASLHAKAALSAPPVPRELVDPSPPSHRALQGVEPAPATRVSVPAPMSRAVQDAVIVFPEHPRVVVHADGVVLARIDRAFHVRSDCLRAVLPDASGALHSTLLRRRGRGLVLDEPLGGLGTPFTTLEGRGRLIFGAPALHTAFVASLDGEPLYVREDRLIAFDSSVAHETGRLGVSDTDQVPLVALSGSGFVVVSVRGPLHALDAAADRPVQIKGERLIGWLGRLLPRPVPREEAPGGSSAMVALSGTGTLLTDGG